MKKIFKSDSNIESIPKNVIKAFEEFWDRVATIEEEHKITPILFQDKKSGAFYLECHILASTSSTVLDINAVLDTVEQKEYRANRNLQPLHKAFEAMKFDAKDGRQFSDLIVEYNTEYGAEPLKVLGGQHRAEAIKEAYLNGVDRPHGFKVYFALSMLQRNEIAQISNTNIDISSDLLDRMEETLLGPGLRNWCQKVGLLGKKEDFADRRSLDRGITVKIARTFVVNFFLGKKQKYNSEKLYLPYICSSGGGENIDPQYKELLDTKKDLWGDKDLIKAGKNFALLNKRQYKTVSSNENIKGNKEFRNKAITPVVTAAWSYVSGMVFNDLKRQKKLFSLKDAKTIDPLNASGLSRGRHHSDLETYRGVGTRIDKKELGRMTEIFIQFLESSKNIISEDLIDFALRKHFAKEASEDVEKARKKL